MYGTVISGRFSPFPVIGNLGRCDSWLVLGALPFVIAPRVVDQALSNQGGLAPSIEYNCIHECYLGFAV